MKINPNPFTLQIMGDKWKYRVLTQKKMTSVHGTEFESGKHLALTSPGDKTIDFTMDGVTEIVCKHELIHVYISSLHVGEGKVSGDDFEESICCLLEDKLDIILEQSKKMYKNLQKRIGVNNAIIKNNKRD